MKTTLAMLLAVTLVSGIAQAGYSKAKPVKTATSAPVVEDPGIPESQMGAAYSEVKTTQDCSRRVGGQMNAEIAASGKAPAKVRALPVTTGEALL
ncbi:MAG: hypothetical protein AAB250_08120 [Bdellovibrionota bacterium]